jgi:hypothetical protein
VSTDFDIVVADRVGIEDIAHFVSATANLSIESNDEERPYVTIAVSNSGKAWTAMTIDGPLTIELEDVEDWATSAVLAARWLLQLHVHTNEPRNILGIAQKLACFLAEKGRGAAYDLQAGKVIYPRKRESNYKVADGTEQIIDVIEVVLVLPFDAVSDDTASSLLRVLRKCCPEGVPTRFGTFEPLQNKLLPGDDDSFLNLWKAESHVEYGSSMFWNAQQPCFGGSIFFSNRRSELPNMPDMYARFHQLRLSFDGRALKSDDRWCRTVDVLFQHLCKELGPFYAASYVYGGVRAKGNTLSYTAKTIEAGMFISGRWWQGLPSKPTWLAWFGPQYADKVGASVMKSGKAQVLELNSIFLKMSEKPMNAEELRSTFPALPPELVRTQVNGASAEEIPVELQDRGI